MKARLKRLLSAAGLVRPIPAEWQVTATAEEIAFLGDAPRLYGGGVIANPYPMPDYRVPPPVSFSLRNVTYTPHGLAFVKGRIEEAATFSPVSPPFFRPGDYVGHGQLDEATIVQTEYAISYGDWVGEILLPLAVAGPARGPLVLPARFLRKRPYAAAELEDLGIPFYPVERPVRIVSARVLPKRRFRVRWTTEDVAAFRAAFGISPPAPRDGSLAFLSRGGVTQTGRTARPLPHDALAGLTERRGGQTLQTARLARRDYLAKAPEVDTVIAEHGSAMINLVGWATRNVIEVVNDDWWGPGMMSLARACGVRNYAIVIHRDDPAATVAKVEGWLDRFAAGAPPLWPKASEA